MSNIVVWPGRRDSSHRPSELLNSPIGKGGNRLEIQVVLHGDIAERVKRSAQYAGKEPQDFCIAAFQPGMCGQ